jgi:uncharacterized protein (DUF362 family)
MKKMNRREFLAATLAGLSALALEPLLSACQSPPTPTTSPGLSPQTTSAPATPQLSTALPTEADLQSEEITQPAHELSPGNNLPHLAVARGAEPEELVQRAIGALGGMKAFVYPGSQVLIKPNICVAYHNYEYAATTNPWVVGALVRLAVEAGAKRVQVFDFPFGGSAEEAYTRSGIKEQVEAAGGEMVKLANFKFVQTSIPGGLDLQEADIYNDVLNADVLIDVPIAKHHGLARLTLGMKNLMGTIKNRQAIHANLGQRLADLTSCLRPQLTVIDAVRILTDHGPTGGSLDDVKQLDTIIASADIVAADSYAAGLFGLKPDDLAYIRAGAAMGLGRSDLQNLRIEEI